MKVFKRILSILGWCILALVSIVCIWTTVDKVTGYNAPIFGTRLSVIGSSSMEVVYPGRELPEDTKRIAKNEVIFTTAVKSYEDIKLYDVLTYMSDKSLICHRVVDLYTSNNVQYIVLQGDANNSPDQPIDFTLVKGRVSNVFPSGVGNVLVFLQSGYFFMAICFSGFFICLGIFIYKNFNKKDKKAELVNEPKNNLSNSIESKEERLDKKEKKEKKSKKKVNQVSCKCPKCGNIFNFDEGLEMIECPKCHIKLHLGKREEKNEKK